MILPQMGKYYMKKRVEGWLSSANDDLKIIKNSIHDESLGNMIAFHCQQSIEKCFKSILEAKEQEVLRSHNLILLREKASMFLSYEIEQEDIDLLNELYIDSRYPTDFGLLPDGKPTSDIVNRFYQLALTIYKETKEYLK